MLATGIRLGSAITLDVESVDLERGEVWLSRVKSDRRERVFLNKEITAHMLSYIGGRTTGPLFTARPGKRVSLRHVQRRFAMWLEKADISHPVSIHSLRHTFATGLYRRTRDLYLVKEALRHRSIASTLVYAQPDEDHLRKAILC
jgi:site-specific recombinase XerC